MIALVPAVVPAGTVSVATPFAPIVDVPTATPFEKKVTVPVGAFAPVAATVAVRVDVPPVVPAVAVTVVVVGVVAQVGSVNTSLIRVTGPQSGPSARPATVVPLLIVIEARAMHGADEGVGRVERGRRSDLPEHVAGLGGAGEHDAGARRGGQRRADLEDEHRVRVALPVQGHGAAHAEIAGGVVDTGQQGVAGLPTRAEPRLAPVASAGGGDVGRREVVLGLQRGGVGRVGRPADLGPAESR